MMWPEKKTCAGWGGLTACMKLATEDALYVRQIRDALGGTNREAFESEAATVQSRHMHQHCGIPTPALLDPLNQTNRLQCGAEPSVVTAKTQ